jgi:PAS domain S-box-containing protein
MLTFRDMSIRQKLVLVIVVPSCLAIILSSALIISHQVSASRERTMDDLHAVADVVTQDSVRALVDHNFDSVEKELETLKGNPDVVAARLFDRDGNTIGEYRKSGAGALPFELEPRVSGFLAAGRYFLFSHTVMVGNQRVGSLLLVGDRSRQQAQLRHSILVVLAMLSIAIGLSMLVTARLQGIVSRPIMELATVAREVAGSKDYSIRAKSGGADEVGQLVTAFNQMLDQIQERDTNLAASEERFREMAESISQVFWISNVEKTDMLYISPAYEEVWGRRCGDLYQNPRSWVEAVHPDDRDRVFQAACSKQARGEYDERYRIVRPDGTVRWIRDRAWPIHESNGEVRKVVGIAEDVTERRSTEEALRLQSQIAREMEEGVALVRANDGIIVYANPKFERMFGYGPGELVGQPVHRLNAQSVRSPQDIAREIMSALQRGGKWSGEVHNRKKDGTEFWCSANVSTFEHPDLGPVWISVQADITERKHAEQALHESENRLQALMDNSTTVIYLKDRNGKYLLVNRQFESLFHVTRQQIAGKTDHDIFPAEQADRFRQNDQRVLAAKQPIHFEEVAPHDDGLHTYVSVKFPFCDATGEPFAVGGISTDITDRKRAEQALETQARILEDMVEGVLLYDEQDRILFTNHALDRMFGYEPGELVGQSTFVLNPFPAEDSARIAKQIRQQLCQQPVVQREFLNRRKDGSEFVSESRISRLAMEGHAYQISVVQDITERRQMEREILEISDREQRRMSHDLHDGLCQLLTGTMFAVKTLEQRLSTAGRPEAEAFNEIAELLRRANVEARNIARGLNPLTIEEGGLESALQDLALYIQGTFNIDCRFHCDHAVKVKNKDQAVHLYRIAQEAVNNAVKHGQARRIDIRLQRSSKTVTLEVEDDGIGLPNPPLAASGLGLHIMAYRARMIGGELQLRPGEQRGTIVHLAFSSQQTGRKI